jgi:DNA repair exonuclease SbcCD ATPase subunit
MINFQQVSASNFLSLGQTPIQIKFKSGVNIITGTNKDKSDRSNGTGKSSLMESIYFALYGATIRKIKLADIVNKKNKKKTQVVLDFDNCKFDYRIIRTLKPSSLTLLRKPIGEDRLFNDKRDNISRDSSANTQNDIDDIIGASEEVIQNSVIMGVNQTTPFLAQKKTEKRNYIEGIFDMTIFTDMLKDVRKDYNTNVSELTRLESETSEKNRNYKVYLEQHARFEQSKRERILDIKEKITIIRDKIADLKDTTRDLGNYPQLIKDKEADVEDLHKKSDDITKRLREKVIPEQLSIKTIIIEHNAEIKMLNKQINDMFKDDKCPTCHREMSDHDKADVDQHIDQLKSKIADITDLIDIQNGVMDTANDVSCKLTVKDCGIKEDISEIRTEISSFNDEIRNQSVITSRISDHTDNITDLKTDAVKISKEVNTLDEVIERIEDEIKSNNLHIEETTIQVDILEKIKFILGENGVKSYIINKMLNIFNKQINVYLEKLHANCLIKFDEYFEATIINEKRDECSYHNFSSGEKRNIDIAIMFAFMDLQKIQGKFDCNLMCFDELIDGALDEEGVGYVLDIINEKCFNDDKAIYLITHRKEAASYATGDIIEVIKQDGITKMKP